MLKFSVKVLLLICTLLFGLLLGIQQAEHGVFSIEGLPEEEQDSFYIKKIDDDHVEVAVLGEAFSTKEWEAKQEKWHERNHHNRLSQLGHQIGNVVYSVSRKGAEWVVHQIDKAL